MPNNKKSFYRELLGYLIVIVIAAGFSLLIRYFVIEPFIVPTPSMESTLTVGDKVLVNKLAYKFNDVLRGDIIAFNSNFEEKRLVKRAIGIEGDKIIISENGDIYVNDEKITEPYLSNIDEIEYNGGSYTVGENEIFVMGDNRNNSYDSRYFGNIKKDEIFGKAVFIYGPLSRFGRIESQSYFY